MPWQQLSLEAGDLDPEVLSAFFEQQGALSVTFMDAAEQPLFEPDPGTTPLWSATRVTALFDADADISDLKHRFAEEYGAQALARMHEEMLADQDWERLWLQRFHPMRFGERLWICPDGQRPPDVTGAVLIDLDPGLAFGTGTHATTALCLEWLDRHPPLQQSVLDYGCGSGILAIAALKLGAAEVLGVDIDHQALQASRDNALRNQVGAGLRTGFPGELPDQAFDLLLANILANPLIELAPDLAERVRPGGRLVLSGILPEQAEAVSAAYAPWFTLSGPAERDGWVCLQGRRN
ncbi:MAG TPA: 50S ribosomal protein L11 methyltransferase [Gammaproteobacteria bacterium]|nr:50S ribosomal protein L11 methyltransferase [Gammaproteobacteria bacterium]